MAKLIVEHSIGIRQSLDTLTDCADTLCQRSGKLRNQKSLLLGNIVQEVSHA